MHNALRDKVSLTNMSDLKMHTAGVQVVLFVDDKTVSKGMVKYVSGIPKESIVDVSGEVHVPQEPIQGCSCSQVSMPTTHALFTAWHI